MRVNKLKRKQQPVYMQYVEALFPLRYLNRRRHHQRYNMTAKVIRQATYGAKYKKLKRKYAKQIDVAYISTIVILSIIIGVMVGLSYPMMIHVFFK